MSGIRTLVVDDEPLARQGLRVRLGRESDVDVVGEAEDGPAAVDAILRLKPDLVFLDVQMPGFDGFDVVARTASAHVPAFVFVTAYDRYAMRAFVVHALDYLLKPVTHRRFQESLKRARMELDRNARAESAERLRLMLDARDLARPQSTPATGDAASFARRFTVKDGDRYILIRTSDIDWIEAAANYLKFHVRERSYQVRMTMTELERRLDPAQFVRIHRSTMVNIDRIASLTPEWHGDYDVVLTTGVTLRLGRRYRSQLL